MRDLAKRAARLLLGDYRLNRIYTISLTDLPSKDVRSDLKENQRLTALEQTDFDLAPDEQMRDRRWYGGANAYGFGIWEHDALVCMCWCWDHRRPPGNIWTIQEGEVALVDIITAQSHRGRGLAPTVTHFAAEQLRKQGYRRMYAWIWHNHRSSIRSFEKSGWRYIAFVVELELFRWKQIRLVRNVRRTSQNVA